MRLTIRTGAAVLSLLLVGCATQADLQNLQRETEELRNRFGTMEKSLGSVRNEIKEGVDSTIKIVRKELDSEQKDVQNELDSLRKKQADIQVALDSIRVDLQVTSGKIDDVRILTEKPVADLALLKEDTERRLVALEAQAHNLEKSVTDQEKRIADLGRQKGAEKNTPEDLYKEGMDAFKGGDMPKARELFSRFKETYPSHELAANAGYWIGETYYNEKNFDQAILEFQDVVTKYPAKEKAAAAMFKQAVAFKAIGDLKSARYLLKKLLEDYPASEEAKTAREKLKELN